LPGERRRLVEELLHAQLARVLRIEAAQLNRRTNVLQLGLDSLTALELRNRLEVGLGVELRSTLLWTYPRLDELGAHLTERVNQKLAEKAHAEGLGSHAAPEQSVEVAPAPVSDEELMRALAAELGQP
jgi:acyl carrier protein